MTQGSRTDALKDMLKKEPEDLFLNYALGLEYANTHENYTQAEIQFKKVLALDSNYIAAYYQLGKLFELLNNKAEALAFYNKGLLIAKVQKNNKAINEFGEAVFMLED